MSERDENIIERLEDIQTNEALTRQNLHFLTRLVNDSNLRLIQIGQTLEQIRDILAPRAKSLTISFKDAKGNDMAATITLQVGQKSQATAHEFSGLAGAGVELPLAGAISWASSDATVATVDPASGLVTAVGPGTCNITGTDAANGLSGVGVVSDTPVVAQSLTVDLGPAQ